MHGINTLKAMKYGENKPNQT